mgnify:CR=1 FL=1
MIPSRDLTKGCTYIEKQLRKVLSVTNNKVPADDNFIHTFATIMSSHLLTLAFQTMKDAHSQDHTTFPGSSQTYCLYTYKNL